jgi:hypothetical protein
VPILPSPDPFFVPPRGRRRLAPTSENDFGEGNSYDEIQLRRILSIVDPQGVEHQITNPRQFRRLLESMTPEQFAHWKDNYRFAPVNDLNENMPYYAGTMRDVL